MIEPKTDKTVYKFPEQIPPPVPVPQKRAEDIFGKFRTAAVVPTQPPKTWQDQIVFVTDSLTTPTTYTLYFYSFELNVWKSIALV